MRGSWREGEGRRKSRRQRGARHGAVVMQTLSPGCVVCSKPSSSFSTSSSCAHVGALREAGAFPSKNWIKAGARAPRREEGKGAELPKAPLVSGPSGSNGWEQG